MDMTCPAFMGKLTGSETARAPLGIVILLLPLKVNVWSVAGLMPLDPVTFCPRSVRGRAIVAAVIGRSVRPKALLRRMRTCCAGMVMRRVCRIVEFGKTRLVWLKGGCGRLGNSVSWGIVVQVSTQWPLGGLGVMEPSLTTSERVVHRDGKAVHTLMRMRSKNESRARGRAIFASWITDRRWNEET